MISGESAITVGDVRRQMTMVRNVGVKALSTAMLSMTLGAVVATAGGVIALGHVPAGADSVVLLSESDRNGQWQDRLLKSSIDAIRGGVPCLRQVASFQAAPSKVRLDLGDASKEIACTEASAELFSVVGEPFRAGRGFVADDLPGTVAVAEARVAAAIGKGVDSVVALVGLGGHRWEVRIRGVIDGRAGVPRGVDLWVLQRPGDGVSMFREKSVVGRLADGCTPGMAEAQLRVVYQGLAAASPQVYRGVLVRARTLATARRDEVGAVLGLLMLAIAAISASATAGQALLARAIAQQEEGGYAVRLALGASRARLLGHAVSPWLALTGVAAAGIYAVAWGIVKVLRASVPLDAAIDLREIEPSLALSAAVGLLVVMGAGALGAGGVVGGVDRRLGRLLAGTSGGLARPSRRVLDSAMIAVLVCLSTGLAAQALALTVAASNRLGRALGFDHQGRWVVNVAEPDAFYPTLMASYIARHRLNPGAQMVPVGDVYESLYRPLLEEIGHTPGVRAVTVVDGATFGPEAPLRLGIMDADDQRSGVADGSAGMEVPVFAVTPGYFSLLGLPVVRGRDFTTSDRAAAEKVVIVSERAAKVLWGSAGVINRRIRLRSLAGVWRVVGICADGRYSSSADAGEAVVYLPLYQRPFEFARRKILVSVDGRWSRIASPVTDMIKARGLVAASTSSLSQLLEHRLARINLALYVLGIAAGASLLVTWGSLLGAVRYIVGRERRNIALRMAIGGRPAGIAWAYFGRLLGPVVVGGLAAVLLSGIVYPIVQRIAETDRIVTLAFAGMLAAGTCAAACILLVAAIRNVGEGELAPVLREE